MNPIAKVALSTIPFLGGMLAGRVCEMPQEPEVVQLIPGWVFGVVWSTLYVLLGIFMYSVLGHPARKQILPILLLNLLLNFAWSPVYSCGAGRQGRKSWALLLIAFVLLTALILWGTSMTLMNQTKVTYLLAPYITWLVLATVLLMITYSQQKQRERK